tara:strand:- start:376 stop:534 length:159 start_codon:yes stop_codon:yes gene_type:complete
MSVQSKVKGVFVKVVEFDKKIIKKCQDKWGLSDYQVVCISFLKGFIIGAVLL